MGFFYTGSPAPITRAPKVIPIEVMNAAGCTACPKDKLKTLRSPKQGFISSRDEVDVVFLNSYRSKQAEEDGVWFDSGMVDFAKKELRRSTYPNRTAFMGITRCDSGTPDLHETECCRGYITEWIEELKPKIVLAVGDAALKWATGYFTSVSKWRGRFIPAKIGNHVCWVLPTFDSEFLAKRGGKWESEYDIAVRHDLRLIDKLLDKYREPKIEEDALERGVTTIDGSKPGDMARLREGLRSLQSCARLGLDIETTGLRPYGEGQKILTMAIGTFDNTIAFPLFHPRGWNSSEQIQVRAMVLDFLLNSGRKVCHSAPFEMEWLAYEFGWELLRRTEWDDTRAQSFALDERPGTHSLEALTMLYFGFNVKALSNIDTKRPLVDYPLEDVLRYNGLDTKWTHRLFDRQLEELTDTGPQAEYERLMTLTPTLVLTQLMGVPVDMDEAQKQSGGLEVAVARAQRLIGKCVEVDKFTRMFGSFNPTSPDHVVKLLTDICNRSEVYKGGKVSSDESVLSSIPRSEVPSAALILELREADKLLSTYLRPVLSGTIVFPDGKLHTIFNSMSTVTGRLSSDSPNLQNFPKRKHKEIRRFVAAMLGQWMASLDYGQIEARVIAMASCDPVLVDAMWTDYDIHMVWAERGIEMFPALFDQIAAEFDLDDEKAIMKTARQEFKNKWVFPQFFGSSPRSCARSLNIPEDIAFKIADQFWDEFRGVKKWQDALIKKWEKNLYVETLTGRRRRGPMSRNEIINTPVQGTAADIVTAAMTALSEYADATGKWEYQPVMNIHDDLTFLLYDDTIDADIQTIGAIMTKKRFDFINVPLLVEVLVGPNWSDQTEILKIRSDK